MALDNTPILIGAGLTVQKEKDLEKVKTPLGVLSDAAQNALADAGADVTAIDAIAGIRFVTDSPEGRFFPYGKYKNIALSVANDIGATPSQVLMAATGGNSPQMLINALAERIAEGDVGTALVVGGEGLGSLSRAIAAKMDFSQTPGWNDEADDIREDIGVEKDGCSAVERRHTLNYPVNYYPIFENALRHHLGRDMPTHMQKLGELMQPFTEVAAQNPYSWFPVARSAAEIATVNDNNRLVGYPYPKYMNSVIRVDQAAAVVLTSVGKAREMGIDESKWVYLHGCAEANDIWNPIERPDLYRSHAMQGMAELALDMAGWTVADIDYFDLYSCFPVAVEVACREMNIAEDDPRPFTVTGGLPYFGGPGNAYTLMSIANMAHKLRANPGSKGFCNGNGWFLTKHSLGLYSTTPFEGDWKREAPSVLQGKIDAMDKMVVDEAPTGTGVIESYTVAHVSGREPNGILIGRMAESGKRFCAFMAQENGNVERLMKEDGIGLRGTLSSDEKGINHFVPEG